MEEETKWKRMCTECGVVVWRDEEVEGKWRTKGGWEVGEEARGVRWSRGGGREVRGSEGKGM